MGLVFRGPSRVQERGYFGLTPAEQALVDPALFEDPSDTGADDADEDEKQEEEEEEAPNPRC